MKQYLDLVQSVSIKKGDVSKNAHSLKNVMNAIINLFESIEKPFDTDSISNYIENIEFYVPQWTRRGLKEESYRETPIRHKSVKHDRRHENEGRPEIVRLCALLEDDEVCNAFREARKRAGQFIENPTQYVCCFFTTFFSILGSETPEGKIKHYWKMLKKYIVDLKIPALRTIQHNINHFTKWKDGVEMWLLSKAEKIKFKAWAYLEKRLEKLLPIIEPKLALCAI